MTVNRLTPGDDLENAMNDATDEERWADDMSFIAEALTPQAPPPEVQARVLDRIRARIRAEPDGPPAAPPSMTRALRDDEGDWRPMAPSVALKVLHDDGEFASMLVRMGPGATLPSHAHPRPEECYVVSGDIWLSGVHLRAGDFLLADTDLIHEDIRSETGCLLHLRADNSMATASAW